MKQKFLRGYRVKIDNLLASKSYFTKNCHAIVEYSYFERYGVENCDIEQAMRDYSLIILDNNNNPINSVSWFSEEEFSLVSSNCIEGCEIIEKYYIDLYSVKP